MFNQNARNIVVIGGVAGGMSFATRYRRLNQQDNIIIFEKGPYVSFANCGLPYYMSGEIPSRTRLLVVKEKDLVTKFRFDIRSNSEVIEIIPALKVVKYLQAGVVHEQSYDKLVLSPGAKPIIPTIPNLERRHHFTLRNIPNLDAIMEFIKTNQPSSVAIIGGGYIGLEVAENLHKKGLKVSVIEKSPTLMPVFDREFANIAGQTLQEQGIAVYTNDEIGAIDDQLITLKSTQTIKADFLILAVGVVPETTLAKQAGVKLGVREGMLVDDHFQTSIEDIYAVGDAILVQQFSTGQDTLIPLASPANRQGRQLADVLHGLPIKQTKTLGTAIVRLFNRTFASTGLNERQVKDLSHKVLHVHGYDHASYFPGATAIDLKVIFDATTHLILGAQAMGEKGVDKRIDVIATAIKANMKVTELQNLELTYAPPFGTAKDIVNMAGYIASNLILNISKTIQWHEVVSWQKQGAQFLDVRPLMERMAYGHLEGDSHIELEQLVNKPVTLAKDKPIIVYCDAGAKAYHAEQILRDQGYHVYQLDGGYNNYTNGKGK